jgi:hypothetical protein
MVSAPEHSGQTPVKTAVKDPVPQALVVQAKALYVVKGMAVKLISDQLSIDSRKLSNLVVRLGWKKERDRRFTRYEALALSTAQDANAAFLESMALQSEELAEDGMQMAREVVTRRDEYAAKDFASATQGVKNLVEVFRKVRGIDGGTTGAGMTIGAIYLNAQPAAPRPLKTAEDQATVDVSAKAIPAPQK